MFVDSLIVLILTTAWFESLMRPVLSASKVFLSECLFVNLKPQTNTADEKVVLL